MPNLNVGHLNASWFPCHEEPALHGILPTSVIGHLPDGRVIYVVPVSVSNTFASPTAMESENGNTPLEDSKAPREHDKPRPKKSVSGQEWETYRNIIQDLYSRMTLRQVMAYMADTYNFLATQRMYKTRLSQWGLNKYMKSRDMKNLVQQIQGSKISDLPAEFEIDGKHISRSKVARFAKRQGQALDPDRQAS